MAKLPKTVIDAARARPLAPLDSVGELAGLARTKTVVDDASIAGLSEATTSASQRARDTERASRVAEAAERGVKDAADGSTTSARWLRRITRPVPNRSLDELWERFAPRDLMRLIDEMARRVDAGKRVDHHFVAGFIRELVAKHLPGVRRIVLEQKTEIRALGRRGQNVSFLDTGAMGDVFLPTKVLSAQGRSVELGTDRIIGLARGTPQEVRGKLPDGRELVVTVQGEIEITVAIEVKGRTGVARGVQQLEALRLEERGAGGYALIDGKLWLLKYDPAKVHHVVVAPRGADFDEVARMSKLSGGGRLSVVEIPLELDVQVLAMARYFLKGLDEDVQAAKSARRDRTLLR